MNELPEQSPGFSGPVKIAGVELTVMTGDLAERLIHLKLENDAQEVPEWNAIMSSVAENWGRINVSIPDVRRVGDDVVLRRRIEIEFRSQNGRNQALVMKTKLPPFRVHVPHAFSEYIPPPLVDDVRERKINHFF